jgi:MYXO-CTERM domain-containing protein
MKMRSLVFSAAALSCAALWSTSANAEVGTAPFNPSTDLRLEELPISTGLLPSDTASLAVGLTVTPYQDVSIVMFGDADYDFDATDIQFTGTPDSGVFTNTLGADVTVTVHLDVIGINTEFDVGVYSIEEDAVADFTPYVLPGADPRPIEVAETIGPFALVDQQAFTVPGFGNEGTLDVDFHIDIPGISYESTSIDITDDPDSGVPTELGNYVMEDSNLELTLPNAIPGQTSSVWGELNGLLDSEVSFVFEVTVTVIVLDNPITVGPLEFGVDVPIRQDEPVVFEPEEMQFMVPEEPAPATTGDDGTSTGTPPDSDSDSAGTTTDDPGGSSGGEVPDTDSGGVPADGFGEGDSGCGCSTADNRREGGLAFGLGLLGLLALRRRRRS